MTPEPEHDFDAITAERKQAEGLLGLSVHLDVERKSIFRKVGKPTRRFYFRPLLPGTLLYLCREFVLMDFDEGRLQADPVGESKRLMSVNLYRLAKIAAIAILNGKWKIRLFTPLLTNYLLWRLDSKKLLQLTMLINEQSNLADFTNSIRFLSIQPRVTAPARIEKPTGKAGDSAASTGK